MYDDTYLRSMSRADIMSESEENRRKVLIEHLRVVSGYRMQELTLVDYCDIFFSCDAPIIKQDFERFMGLCDLIANCNNFGNYTEFRDVLTVDDIEVNTRFKWHVMRSDKGILNKCVKRIAECHKYRSVPYFKALVYAYISSHGAPIRVISDFFSDADKIRVKDIEMYTRLFTRFDWCAEAFMTLTLAGYTFANMATLIKKVDADSGAFPYWDVPEKLLKRKIEPYKILLSNLPEVPADYSVPREFFD